MANWYVDNSVGASGNGQSWATAWKDFNNIVWGSIAAGDVINVSGGASGQTYGSQLMVVGASGAVGNPITIQAATDAGKNGPVTLDGTTSMTFGAGGAIIDTNSKTNLIIQNFIAQNTLESCVRITGCASGSILLQGITTHSGPGILTLATNGVTAPGSAVLNFASVPAGIANGAAVKDATSPGVLPSPVYVSSKTATTVTLGSPATGAGVGNGDQIQFAFNARGFRVDTQTGGAITIRNCTFDDPSNTIAQTDAWFSVNNTGGPILVENCTFIVNNTDPSGHSDTIQSVNDANLTVRKCFLAHPNGGVNNHGILISDVVTGGEVDIYDNILWMGGTKGSKIGVPEVGVFRQVTQLGFTGISKIYNNTFFVDSVGYLTFQSVGTLPAGDEFKNNIIYGTQNAYSCYDHSSGNVATPANINNNLSFINNGGGLRVGAISSTLGGVKGTTSHSTGKWYFEFQLGTVYAGGDTLFGIANAALNMSLNWLGQTLDGIGYWWSSGGMYLNAGNTAVQTAAPWDLVAVAIDLDNKKWWVKNLTQGSGWNNAAIGSQDPANNVGGVSFATINAGPYFICFTANSDGAYGVFNTGGSSFFGTVPNNFSAWGATDVLNAGTAVGGVSTTPAVGKVSGASKTFAAWQTAGYDVAGVNADPQLRNPGTQQISDYIIGGSSPAINAGATLALVTSDILGVTRPQRASFDIGAFELPFFNPVPGGQRLSPTFSPVLSPSLAWDALGHQ